MVYNCKSVQRPIHYAEKIIKFDFMQKIIKYQKITQPLYFWSESENTFRPKKSKLNCENDTWKKELEFDSHIHFY